MTDQELRIFEREKIAMTIPRDVPVGLMIVHRQAVLDLVSLERSLRQAAEKLLAARYRDGECDSVTLKQFECEVAEAIDCCAYSGEPEKPRT